MKSSDKNSPSMPKKSKSPKVGLDAGNWQATFSKRLPHRIGQPLSSGGGGDGCMAPTAYAYEGEKT